MKVFRKIKILVLIFAYCGVVISFQNCGGDVVPLNDVVIGQGIYDSQTDLDSAVLAKLIDPSQVAYWSKNGSVKNTSHTAFGEAFSLVVAVRRAATGVLLSINSGTNSEEARITFDATNMYIVHLSDVADFSYLVVPIPTGVDSLVVAATFSTDPTQFNLQVNGKITTSAVVKVGTPFNYGYLLKSNLLGADSNVLEAVSYSRALSVGELNSISRYVAKSSGVPNVIFDPAIINYGDTGTTLPTPAFLAAKGVIDSNCMSCHGAGGTGGSFANLSENQFIAKGLVVPQSPATSKIYFRLNGALSGTGPANMPQGGTLSTTQIQTIAVWINGIGGTAPTVSPTPAPTPTPSPPPVAERPQFTAAKATIVSNCSGCHSAFAGYSEVAFISAGYVIKQNLTGSKLYFRLNGATVGPGPRTMPQGGALTATQIQGIADWINSIP